MFVNYLCQGQPQANDRKRGDMKSQQRKKTDSPASRKKILSKTLDSTTYQWEEYSTDIELAKRWGLSDGTLRNWRTRGRGPIWSKFGRCVRYKIADALIYESISTSHNGGIA